MEMGERSAGEHKFCFTSHHPMLISYFKTLRFLSIKVDSFGMQESASTPRLRLIKIYFAFDKSVEVHIHFQLVVLHSFDEVSRAIFNE